MPHISDAQDALASIEAMRIQEQTGYKTEFSIPFKFEMSDIQIT